MVELEAHVSEPEDDGVSHVLYDELEDGCELELLRGVQWADEGYVRVVCIIEELSSVFVLVLVELHLVEGEVVVDLVLWRQELLENRGS